jgi:hypothetical protein
LNVEGESNWAEHVPGQAIPPPDTLPPRETATLSTVGGAYGESAAAGAAVTAETTDAAGAPTTTAAERTARANRVNPTI